MQCVSCSILVIHPHPFHVYIHIIHSQTAFIPHCKRTLKCYHSHRIHICICHPPCRSSDGVCWMGEVLVQAIEAVNSRRTADSGGRTESGGGGGAKAESGETPARKHDSGLFDVCGALFRYCVACIGGGDGGQEDGGSAEGENRQVNRPQRCSVEFLLFERVFSWFVCTIFILSLDKSVQAPRSTLVLLDKCCVW